MKVGDSRYDLESARDAGYGRVVLLGERARPLADEADLWLPSLEALRRHLLVVL